MKISQFYVTLFLASYLRSKEKSNGVENYLVNAFLMFSFILTLNIATLFVVLVGLLTPEVFNANHFEEIATISIMLISALIGAYIYFIKIDQSDFESLEGLEDAEKRQMNDQLTYYLGASFFLPLVLGGIFLVFN